MIICNIKKWLLVAVSGAGAGAVSAHSLYILLVGSSPRPARLPGPGLYVDGRAGAGGHGDLSTGGPAEVSGLM